MPVATFAGIERNFTPPLPESSLGSFGGLDSSQGGRSGDGGGRGDGGESDVAASAFDPNSGHGTGSSVGDGRAAAAAHRAGDDEHGSATQQGEAGSSGGDIDLLYDPILSCYFDPKTNRYYQLASE
eukprot:SAG22_NODE_4797_length_1160_cov_2.579031_2_plen_126_part_00